MPQKSNINTTELSKKIRAAEICIIAILISMWLLVWALMTHTKNEYVHRIVQLQEQMLPLVESNMNTSVDNQSTGWPFTQAFNYIVIKDDIIVSTGIDDIKGQGLTLKEAFGQELNFEAVLNRINNSDNGSDWISKSKAAKKKWLSWSCNNPKGYIYILISQEEDLIRLSGFNGFSSMLMICAGLGSAILLLSLIWALSWLRLSAIKGLR